MKKVVAAAAAFLAAVAPCSMFFASIEPVKASAADVTLTVEQTRALFGDSLYSLYFDGSDYHEAFFTYFDTAVISQVSHNANYPGVYNPAGKYCLVYALDSVTSNSLQNVGTSYWSCDVRPVFDIQGLNRYTLSCGYSFDLGANGLWDFWPDYGMSFSNDNSNSAAITASKYIVYSDYRNTDTIPVEVTNYLPYYNDAGWLYGRCARLTFDSHSDNVYFSCYSCDIQNYDKTFNVYGNYVSENGLIQYGRVEKPSGTFVDSDISARIFFYIECPVLTSGYIASNPPSWDSSSGSGSDTPDYSGDLQAIIDKLDAIVANGYVIDGALDDLIDIGQGVHGDLQGVNSRLDKVNSTLNQIDSHIQGLQIPDLMSQSSGDMSHIAQNESRNNSDLRAADANQQVINSVAAYGDVSIPNLDNVHSMPDDFSELWNYTDQDGLSWVNPILYAMPILTLTVGALAYIVFGRAR